jgi:hypothetical protein
VRSYLYFSHFLGECFVHMISSKILIISNYLIITITNINTN